MILDVYKMWWISMTCFILLINRRALRPKTIRYLMLYLFWPGRESPAPLILTRILVIFITFQVENDVLKTGNRNTQYRSKHFDDVLFKYDIASATYHVDDIFDDFDDIYIYADKTSITMLHLNKKGLLKKHYHL